MPPRMRFSVSGTPVMKSVITTLKRWLMADLVRGRWVFGEVYESGVEKKSNARH
jgi:hypothetical protein